MVEAPTRNSIHADYEERFAGSKALAGRARNVIAGGIVHDGRYMRPFPLYIDRADGAYKWDVDGHKLMDFGIGHGSLILGHNDPDIIEAVQEALLGGTHFSAGHEREVLWAEQIQKLIPSAEQVRFTASGTESTLLACRIARAHTDKPTMLKFDGHFHGWNDYLLKGEKPPFEHPTSPGVPDAVLGTVSVVPANDLAMVEERLSQEDVAGIILEPSGASWTSIPLEDQFLAGLRDLATKYGAVLVFDEVITGFRWSPGGAQARFGVIPDLTTMAKIVAGGMPGGAVGGQTEFMQHMAFKDEPGWNATKKVSQNGTFNANPVTAAAGLACLRKCADPAVQEYCDSLATRLRIGLNTAFEQHAVAGCAWGDSSVFHIIVGEPCGNRTAGDLRRPEGIDPETLKASPKAGLAPSVYMGMLLEGIDLFAGGGMLSTAHTEADVDAAIGAFERVLMRLRDEGAIM
ncbi:MAG: aspartate aminotransferase family protein [Thermomicrobiales bacterium]